MVLRPFGPIFSDQPHAETNSRGNTESLYGVGITPRKNRTQIPKMAKNNSLTLLFSSYLKY